MPSDELLAVREERVGGGVRGGVTEDGAVAAEVRGGRFEGAAGGGEREEGVDQHGIDDGGSDLGTGMRCVQGGGSFLREISARQKKDTCVFGAASFVWSCCCWVAPTHLCAYPSWSSCAYRD